MEGVDFRFDPEVILGIAYLRGRLVPARSGEPPWFDDKQSFAFQIDSARVSVRSEAMAALLNRYLFPTGPTPLRGLRVAIHPTDSSGRTAIVELHGRLYGFPFRTRGVAELTEGEIRIRTTSVHVIGMPAKGVMNLVGLSLEKLVDWKKARGVRALHNDLVLSPAAMLPAPAVEGRLVAVEFTEGGMTQIFRSSARVVTPLAVPDSTGPNYMYYQGGTLRFGRLTMQPADLLVRDLTPSTPLDFFLDHYREQLDRGYARATADGRLITYLPDFGDISRDHPRK